MNHGLKLFLINIFIILYSEINLAPISHNVLGIRRFAVAYKGFAKQRPATVKCGWKEAWEWSEAECPSRLEARSRLQAAERIPFVRRCVCAPLFFTPAIYS